MTVRSGDKVAFGNDVVVEENEVVRSNVVCLGGTAIVKGKVRGDVVVIGGKLEMSGSSRGEVVGVGSRMVLADSTEIAGDFVNVGGSAERNDAKIHGQFVNVGIGLPLTGLASAPFTLLGFLIFWGKVLWLVLLFIAFLLLAASVPDRIRVISEETPVKFGIALLAGFVGCILFILLGILTAITIIGIPITILMFFVLAAFDILYLLDGHDVRLALPADLPAEVVGDVHVVADDNEGGDMGGALGAIPQFRGRHGSRPLGDLVAEVEALAARGLQEAILVSQDTLAYGRDVPGNGDIGDLLLALSDTPMPWIRPMYLHPAHVNDRLLAKWARARVVPYVDMPIQHADDGILRAMRRGVTARRMREIVEHLRESIPGVTVRTTILVGFPGETDAAFERLLGFVEDVAFDRLGVFTYSEEEGTPAAALGDRKGHHQVMPLELHPVDEDRAELRHGQVLLQKLPHLLGRC